ncbi:hypothetical protein [Cytobacillus firmus]
MKVNIRAVLVAFIGIITIFITSFQPVSASEYHVVEGKLVAGLLFDDTVTEEMKQRMLNDGRAIVKTNDGEMMQVLPNQFTVELKDVKNQSTYKTIVSHDGNYNFSDIPKGKYKINFLIGDTSVSSEKSINVNKNKINNTILSISLDDYLNFTMHASEEEPHVHMEEGTNTEPTIIEENEQTVETSHEMEESAVAYSHKYPNLPCLDYNGYNAPDSRHVHDYAHFYGSDCYMAAYAKCAFDHKDSLEYCDGTRNCSTLIGHNKNYHKHTGNPGTMVIVND